MIGTIGFTKIVTDYRPLRFVDNRDATYAESGTGWAASTEGTPQRGDFRLHVAGTGGNTATWKFDGLQPGQRYEVFTIFVSGPDRATNAPYTILDGSKTLDTVWVNQQTANRTAIEGQALESLGTFTPDPSIGTTGAAVPLGGGSGGGLLLGGDPVAEVVGRRVFYNNSVWDATSDNDALAPDKEALLPGETATFASITIYYKGINGVMVDVADLPEGITTLENNVDIAFRVGNTSSPTTWSWASAPIEISIERGGGSGGSDRVKIIWSDYDITPPHPEDSIQQQWLQVALLATENTGLPADDIFYFGNLIAEADGVPVENEGVYEYVIDSFDIQAILATGLYPGGSAPIDCVADFNRDGVCDSYDIQIILCTYGWPANEPAGGHQSQYGGDHKQRAV